MDLEDEDLRRVVSARGHEVRELLGGNSCEISSIGRERESVRIGLGCFQLKIDSPPTWR